jgi:transglutaminase-like putative cysteine protease
MMKPASLASRAFTPRSVRGLVPLIVLAAGLGAIAGCQYTESEAMRGTPPAEESVAASTPMPAVVLTGTAPIEPVPHLVNAELEAAIRRHIEEVKASNAGLFPIPFEGGELKLKLVRVHTEYLATVGENLHFACVDLATDDGNLYDVDFFMRGTTKDARVTETMVHKLNGKPYYVWEQGKDERWERRTPSEASKKILGVLTGHDEFAFSYQATLPELKAPARMWVPIASSDAFQQVSVAKIIAPGTSKIVKDQQEGNQILVLDLSPADSGKALEIRYQVHRHEKSAYAGSEAEAMQYLEADARVPDAPRFREISERVLKGKTTTLERARALYDHTMDEIKYMKHGSGWGQGDAIYACDAKSGNCTDFHAYFIALCRASGIPARFAIGASIPSERNEGSMDGYHCWAEFYADGRWWPVDISEADKYITLAGYYFGHHPSNRFELSRGRDLIVDPMPASGPINFLAYPLLEVNGEIVKVKTVFGFEREAE